MRAVAVRAGPNADGRDVQSRGDALGYLGRNAFQHHRKGAGCFQGKRVFHQVMNGCNRFALHPVPAHPVY